jgi:hypothetical protein
MSGWWSAMYDRIYHRDLLEHITTQLRQVIRQQMIHELQLTKLGNHMEVDMTALRDEFDADEQGVEDQLTQLNTNVAAVAAAIQGLPTSLDALTQADLDRVHAQGDALATANTALTALVTPAAPVDPSA